MSSTSSPILTTPPDPVADAQVKNALDLTALDDTLSEAPAVGGFHVGRLNAWDWSTEDLVARKYAQQTQHSVRLGRHLIPEGAVLSRSPSLSPSTNSINVDGNAAYSRSVSPLAISRSSSLASSEVSSLSDVSAVVGLEGVAAASISASTGDKEIDDGVQVKCMVRTRVPTPHGEVFLHLYHNNRDGKEHLAIVVDPAQLTEDQNFRAPAPFIRSKSLDAVWYDDETPVERITRGAYVGRLSPSGFNASAPIDADARPNPAHLPGPLVRIHSECFTGETIGSMRCDCGEQLDEALRRIAEPITFVDRETNAPTTIPGRGAVIYMRQEGRGIGLLSKLRAYNLQDLGHDTVQANLLLGHGADERGYDVAAAIMRDLGLSDDVRLLTNNPDKVQKLTDAGVPIAERVPMVPRAWQCQSEDTSSTTTIISTFNNKTEAEEEAAARLRSAGATLIGAGAAHGSDLEKYLRTKVTRMGHMLSLPSSGAAALY